MSPLSGAPLSLPKRSAVGNLDVPDGWKWAPASIVGTSTDTTGNLTWTIPSGTRAGDLLVISAATRNSSLGTPSGAGTLTTIFYGDTGSNEYTGAWAKICNGSEAGDSVTSTCSATITAGGLTVIRRDDGQRYTEFDYTGGVDRGTGTCPNISAYAGDLWVGLWVGCYNGTVTQNTIGSWWTIGSWTKGHFTQYNPDAWASCQFKPVVRTGTAIGRYHNANDAGYLSNGCLVAR